jgi:hypothetical protein
MSASRAFSNSYNKLKSANDYTNRKKAETIFEVARNKNVNKIDGEKYIGPIIKTSDGFLAAVGGFNVNSYDILFNVVKGQSYLATPCITSNGNEVLLPINDCSLNIKCKIPNSSYDIFEGPYLENAKDVSCGLCLSSQTKEYTQYDPSYIIPPTGPKYPFTQLTHSNIFQNFYLHGPLQIDCSGN